MRRDREAIERAVERLKRAVERPEQRSLHAGRATSERTQTGKPVASRTPKQHPGADLFLATTLVMKL